uniref:Uncharacterized protein n=1 Tax=Clytia hemisphaerica TaxID=252671 RepID=A0A7M5VAU5_9CNID
PVQYVFLSKNGDKEKTKFTAIRHTYYTELIELKVDLVVKFPFCKVTPLGVSTTTKWFLVSKISINRVLPAEIQSPIFPQQQQQFLQNNSAISVDILYSFNFNFSFELQSNSIRRKTLQHDFMSTSP